MENPANIGWLCPDHVPRPDAQYFDKPFEWFVGKSCKLGFLTGLKSPRTEFMWVQVTGQDTIDGVRMLTGYLDNDPAYVRDYRNGDGVAFERNEICDVHE